MNKGNLKTLLLIIIAVLVVFILAPMVSEVGNGLLELGEALLSVGGETKTTPVKLMRSQNYQIESQGFSFPAVPPDN